MKKFIVFIISLFLVGNVFAEDGWVLKVGQSFELDTTEVITSAYAEPLIVICDRHGKTATVILNVYKSVAAKNNNARVLMSAQFVATGDLFDTYFTQVVSGKWVIDPKGFLLDPAMDEVLKAKNFDKSQWQNAQ